MKSPARPLIEIRALRRTFVNGAVESVALDGIDLTIHEGEFVAICGASGSGKSTLLNILGCLDRPSAGTYRLAGLDVSQLTPQDLARLRQETFGFVFQRYHLIAGMSAIDNVEVPAVYAGLARDARRARSAHLMSLLGLEEHAWKSPSQLSGGQQQRVAIGRALINGGSVILADEPTGALDSRNGAEVISVLRELAQTGRTVILITHDPHIAAHTDRTIEIADGKVVSESKNAPVLPADLSVPDGPEPQSAGAAAERGRVARSARGNWRWSPIAEATRSAFASIGSNPVRTGLTLLGVVIGVASVVALLAIGRGSEADMLERISTLGTNWILVTDERDWSNPYKPLTPADAEAIAELQNIASSVPGEWRDGLISSGNRETKTGIFGATLLYCKVHHWDVSSGAFFSEEDEMRGAAVTVLGKVVAEKLFPGVADPSGEIVLIERIPFTVSGVLEEKGIAPDGENYDNRILVPINAMMNRIESDRELDTIVVELNDMGKLKETREAIRALMIERHGKEDSTLYDTVDAHRKATEERAAMNIRLAAIGGISLLVGGIGIMNMMLTSVRERTREISIRTAAGATQQDILRQFIIEAVVISGVGGAIGLVLGIAIGAGAALLSGVTVILSLTSAALMFLAAASLGVIFGFMPARHAARLDPAAALAVE